MPSTPDTPTRYRVAHYGDSRLFALYEGQQLLAVTVYKRGADTVRQALEARDAVIAAQAAQIAQLTAAAPDAEATAHVARATRWRGRIPPHHEAQLALFADEPQARHRGQSSVAGRWRE